MSINATESETIEFKESLGLKEKAGEDLAAFANKSGGIIYFGIKDNGTIIGIQNISEKTLRELSQVFTDNTEPKIYPDIIAEIVDGKNIVKVIVKRSASPHHTFKSIPYIRVGSSSKKMSQSEYQSRLLAHRNDTYDFSSRICLDASFDDLDTGTLEILKKRWSEKERDERYLEFSGREVLEKLLLIRQEGVTYAALLLCGKVEKIAEYIPEAEIRFGWKNDVGKIDFDFTKDWRLPFLVSVDEIWEVVNARNTRMPFEQGFFEGDVWAFDQKSVREAIMNAFAHRDYEERGSVFIEATPLSFIVTSPGSFVSGVSSENILDVQGKWRNRLLMETLGKIGLVERYGHGLDRIFKRTISEGRGTPTIEELAKRFVRLFIPTQIRDEKFVMFLEKVSREKHIGFDFVKDFVFLDEIREKQTSSDSERKERFLRLGVLEKVGKGRGTKYLLSREFYDLLDGQGEYTRKKWLSKDQQKEVLWNFFRQHKKGRMANFRDEVFEGKLGNAQVLRLLELLKTEGKIYFDGPQRSPKSYWRIREGNDVDVQ